MELWKTTLEKAIYEYKHSQEYDILSKRHSQLAPYGFTKMQIENAISEDIRKAEDLRISIAIKYHVNPGELV